MALDVFFGTFLAIILVGCLASGTPPLFSKRDETDSHDERSGLSIYTDYGTGVQYVATIQGGLTVRVDKDGKPMITQEIDKDAK